LFCFKHFIETIINYQRGALVETIIFRVENVRSDLKLSKKDFCKIIEVSEPAYQNYLQKKRDLPLSIIYNLSSKLHISANWLINNIEPIFLMNNINKLSFEQHEVILESLSKSEIAESLYFTYIEKNILPVFRDLGDEKPLWRKIINGHRDRIGAIFYLLRSLQNINNNENITYENARNLLLNAINEHIVTLYDHFKFVYLSKDEVINAIEKIDDMGCYIILKNSKMIFEALSPFLKSIHLNDLNTKN